MPICVSAKCLTRLRGDRLCGTLLCPVQVTARIWAHCKGHICVHLLHAKRLTTILLWRPACTSTRDRCLVQVLSRNNMHWTSEIYVRGYRKLVALPLMFAAMGLSRPCAAREQSNALSGQADIHFGDTTRRTTCGQRISDQPVIAALRLVCLRERLGAEDITLNNVIVIGFVGATRGSMIGKEKKTNLSICSSEIGGTTVCSPMLTVQAVPTGGSLVQGGCCEICVHEKYEAEFNPLHMNWVLVDDTKGSPRAQMRWVVDR